MRRPALVALLAAALLGGGSLPAAAAQGPIPMEYGSALLVIDGVVDATPSRDRFSMTDASGARFDVSVVAGKTFVGSPDVIRVGHSVQVYGHAGPRGEDIVAEEVDSHTLEAFSDKKHNGTLKVVLGAAAGILVGSGIYGLYHGWFHGSDPNAPGSNAGTGAVPASVNFGGGQ